MLVASHRTAAHLAQARSVLGGVGAHPADRYTGGGLRPPESKPERRRDAPGRLPARRATTARMPP
jgi:hypothetical protein